ncbi:uncharacterized protein LOC122316247 [Carya illinoinensis]|uniref:uncharacterized protein LOC122316247 n=1 Tax=Carya illinoinensis TaxID=32201 RepID=UPI001C721361|nr:uncharacterized protein LOC122316247 [Carya illinoinensis]
MICISWNCRGLGNPRGVRALRDLVRKEVPMVLFLQETKLHVTKMECVKRLLGYECCFAVSSEGRSGGLALMWQEETNLNVQSYSKNHIDALIHNAEHDGQWQFTGVYGHPDTELRQETWNTIRSLRGTVSVPWLVCGDFNEVLCWQEKRGGRNRPERQMRTFRQLLDDCSFVDLGFMGPPFTWCNKRDVQHTVSERLDRYLANQGWIDWFPGFRVVHGSSASSDHLPILLYSRREKSSKRNKLFRFEAMWTEEGEYENIVEDSWNGRTSGNQMNNIKTRIGACSQRLAQWNKTKYGNVQKRIQQCRTHLQQVQERDPYHSQMELHQEARCQLQMWLEREEILWCQRAKSLWLQGGDQNTKYFH